MTDEFHLHEDDWGMIELVPRENSAGRRTMVQDAAAHREAHRAADGAGWTEIFQAPAAKVSIEIRGIRLSALADALGADWRRCTRVRSGYSPHYEDCGNAFAFRPPAEHGWCVIYGTFRDDVVTSLYVTYCELPIMPALHRLGTMFELILCDLWQDIVVDLADAAALTRYMPVDDD